MDLKRGASRLAGRTTKSAVSGGEREPSDTLARLMALYFVVAVGKIGDVIPGFRELPLAKFVAAIAIIIAIRSRAAPAISWKSVPPAKFTIAVMGVTTVSILWSVLRSGSLGVITGSVLGVLVTQFLVIKAARSWPTVRMMIHGTVFASIVLVATVLTTRYAGSDRAGYSSSYDPNDFAYVLIGLLPIVTTFGVVSKRAKRLLYFGIACMMILAMLLTQSRGGFIGLIFDIGAMTFALPVAWRGQLLFQTSKSKVFARVALLALIGVAGWQSLPENDRSRLSSISELGSDYNANATDIRAPTAGRLAIWSRNLPLILDRPWGFGAGTFTVVDGRFAGGRYRAAHNTFLQALMELGIPGFVLFMATIVSSLRYLGVPSDLDPDRAGIASRDEPRAFARALGIGLVGLCISGFFLSELFANVFWTLIALSCAVGIARRLPETVDIGAVDA